MKRSLEIRIQKWEVSLFGKENKDGNAKDIKVWQEYLNKSNLL